MFVNFVKNHLAEVTAGTVMHDKGCFKRFEENTKQNSMGKDSPDVFDDVETEEEEYDHNREDEQEEDDEDVEEDDESSIDERPWKKLLLEVIDDMSSNYDEQVER